MYFYVVDDFNHILKMLLSLGDIFLLAKIPLWMTKYVNSRSEATSLTRVVNTEIHPVMAATLCIYWPQMTHPVFLICNHSNTRVVLQLWYWLATKVDITYSHAHRPEHLWHKNKHYCLVVSISKFVNLVCVPWRLINSNNCVSVSSAFSLIHLVMLLDERGMCATF